MKGGVCLVNVVFMFMPATPRLVEWVVKWPVSYISKCNQIKLIGKYYMLYMPVLSSDIKCIASEINE